MRKIIVNTGYMPYDIVQKSLRYGLRGTLSEFTTMIPEINIVNQTNELLNNMNDNDVLEVATNNVVAVYAIRAYVVKHADEYDIEYRYYTMEDYQSNNPSQYQLVKQGAHGDFINPPEGFFDTIDNLLNQMLGLD